MEIIPPQSPPLSPSWGKRGEPERRQGRGGRGFGAVWPSPGSNSPPHPHGSPPHGPAPYPRLNFPLQRKSFLFLGKSCINLSSRALLLYLEGNSLGFGSAGRRLALNLDCAVYTSQAVGLFGHNVRLSPPDCMTWSIAHRHLCSQASAGETPDICIAHDVSNNHHSMCITRLHL